MEQYFQVTFDELLSGYEVTWTSEKSGKTLSKKFPEFQKEKAKAFCRQQLEYSAQAGWTRLYVGDATKRAAELAGEELVMAAMRGDLRYLAQD